MSTTTHVPVPAGDLVGILHLLAQSVAHLAASCAPAPQWCSCGSLVGPDPALWRPPRAVHLPVPAHAPARQSPHPAAAAPPAEAGPQSEQDPDGHEATEKHCPPWQCVPAARAARQRRHSPAAPFVHGNRFGAFGIDDDCHDNESAGDKDDADGDTVRPKATDSTVRLFTRRLKPGAAAFEDEDAGNSACFSAYASRGAEHTPGLEKWSYQPRAADLTPDESSHQEEDYQDDGPPGFTQDAEDSPSGSSSDHESDSQADGVPDFLRDSCQTGSVTDWLVEEMARMKSRNAST